MDYYKIKVLDHPVYGDSHIVWILAETPDAALEIAEQREPCADGYDCIGMKEYRTTHKEA